MDDENKCPVMHGTDQNAVVLEM
ncbi:MAG: hypothetical protein JWQ55_5377, partial [Rhodopila sp.]|nr:hypothetical protein [Rhodopila sp.]